MFGRQDRSQTVSAIIPRSDHKISRKDISHNALKVLYRLHEAGYSAYIVGGGVRDLLLGHKPKDFDVATDASPEQVKKLFRNCILIGRRFRLAHVRFGYEVIEVATFRAAQTSKRIKEQHTAEHGMLLRDNVYGTFAEDAERRDFTINALYYNIADFSVVDFWNGMQDLQQGLIRMIGEPRSRYHEDPVRLLRVVRFAGKLGFSIETKTAEPITELAPLLQHVPAARLFDEVLKLFHSGKALATLQLLRQYGLFQQLLPQLATCLTDPRAEKMLALTCENTDTRIAAHKTVSPAFLFACLLWYPLQNLTQQLITEGQPANVARNIAAHEVIAKQIERITIPRRYSIAIREIWNLQDHLIRRKTNQIMRLLTHPRFRAAYDFLLLRVAIGEALAEQANWWTHFAEADETTRQQLLAQLPKQAKRRRKKSKSHEPNTNN